MYPTFDRGRGAFGLDRFVGYPLRRLCGIGSNIVSVVCTPLVDLIEEGQRLGAPFFLEERATTSKASVVTEESTTAVVTYE